jgi:hypothetical protein
MATLGRPRIHADAAARQRAWRKNNGEVYRERQRLYELNRGPGWANAKAAKYRARHAIVPATDVDAIRALHIEAQRLSTAKREMSVDHVLPLHGKLVSGLHVSWNMQILPTRANCSKNRKFDQDAESAAQHALTLSRLKP